MNTFVSGVENADYKRKEYDGAKMPTTIPSAFEQFRQNLEVTTPQKPTLSTRQQNVRQAVEAEFEVIDSFLGGSYARRTMISPLKEADIDIFVVLDGRHYKSTAPKSLLADVRDAIKTTYPKTPQINRDGQAVTITFTDFRVDVVPIFNRSSGGYWVLSKRLDKWIATNPRKHESYLTTANTAHGGALIPIVKMIKAWNRTHDSHFRSFYLELMTEEILRGVRITNAWSGVRYVFDKGRERIKYTVADPAGFSDPVYGLSDIDVATAVKWFDWAYAVSLKAENLGNRGMIKSAYDEWRKLFGDYFPAYG